MYKKEGKEPPKTMDDTVVYNRGLLSAALHVEALKNALKPQAEKADRERCEKRVRTNLRFHLGGLVPPLELPPKITKAAAG